MNESIHKYFKVGTIQWMSFPERDVLRSMRDIACDDFFDAIEICSIEDGAVREQAKKILAQSGLQVCYGAQPSLLGPKLNPNAIDEKERLSAESVLLKAVDEADYLGAKGVAFLAGKWAEQTRDEACRQLLKTTTNVCAYAAGKNMSVNIEVFDYDIDKAVLLGPAPYAAKFAAEMRCRCNNFGLLVDLSHFPLTRETSDFVVRTLRPYIRHFHIGNAVVKEGCEAYGDMHPWFGYPNSANSVPELVDFFRVLKREGFFCEEDPYVLSFEVKPWKSEEADLILANTKRVINRAWALA